MKMLDQEMIKEQKALRLLREADDPAYKTLLRGHLMLYHNVFPKNDLTTKELEKLYQVMNYGMTVN